MPLAVSGLINEVKSGSCRCKPQSSLHFILSVVPLVSTLVSIGLTLKIEFYQQMQDLNSLQTFIL